MSNASVLVKVRKPIKMSDTSQAIKIGIEPITKSVKALATGYGKFIDWLSIFP